MLGALDLSDSSCLAWETEKKEGPFVCPECRGEVILKKGYVKEHHYAHKPPFNCQYGSGESQIHFNAKREIYLNLKKHPQCTKCKIERRLDGVRPDISLYIGKSLVAIEIQRSSVDISEIIRKAKRYSELGIYLIYLFPTKAPKLIWHEGEDQHVCRPNQWEKFLHSMYFGRVYYWAGGLNLNPIHFDEFQTWIEGKEWYDSCGNVQSGGSYWKTTKTLKIPRQFSSGCMNLVEDFRGLNRDFHIMKNWIVPSCKIWVDKHRKWW